MWPFINENKQQLDKKEKKMQHYLILDFFSKKIYFQRDKSH